jgi:hypothetical protein
MRKEKSVFVKFLYRGLPSALLFVLAAFVQFFAIRAFL